MVSNLKQRMSDLVSGRRLSVMSCTDLMSVVSVSIVSVLGESVV